MEYELEAFLNKYNVTFEDEEKNETNDTKICKLYGSTTATTTAAATTYDINLDDVNMNHNCLLFCVTLTQPKTKQNVFDQKERKM